MSCIIFSQTEFLKFLLQYEAVSISPRSRSSGIVALYKRGSSEIWGQIWGRMFRELEQCVEGEIISWYVRTDAFSINGFKDFKMSFIKKDGLFLIYI